MIDGAAYDGNFFIPHYKIIGYFFIVVSSTGLGWEHVSVSLNDYKNKKHPKYVKRCPTWEEMCYVKRLFWSGEEAAYQIHPPDNNHVNCHQYCLHLWKPIGVKMPLPESILVGPNIKEEA
jgi:hypothetical protein